MSALDASEAWRNSPASPPAALSSPDEPGAEPPCRAACSSAIWSCGAARTAPIPRFALKRDEAAAALGMSLDSFERWVQPHLRLIRLGRMVLVPIAELERFADSAAERTLP